MRFSLRSAGGSGTGIVPAPAVIVGCAAVIRAVLWDFGGVILTSPFEAFNEYESQNGLPTDFIRSVNATNPDTNAWALLERTEIGPEEFDSRFADESERLAHRVCGADVLGSSLRGDQTRDGRRPRRRHRCRVPNGMPHEQRPRW